LKRKYWISHLLATCLLLETAVGQPQAERDSSSTENKIWHTDSLILSDAYDSLHIWLSLDPNFSPEKQIQAQQQISDFCSEMQTKRSRFKSETSFLSHVFYQVHSRFLQRYVLNVPFRAIFEAKQYNCVSGTALYALIFKRLGYESIIKETHDHAYLLLKLPTKSILIESTDAATGFLAGEKLIATREKYYGRSVLTTRAISFVQLCGLQFYNEAAKNYQKKNYIESMNLLADAQKLYPDSGKIWWLHRKIRRTEAQQAATLVANELKTNKIITLGKKK
jgi:hypothetical protein